MNVLALSGPAPAPLAVALAEFETQFIYPLGPGRSFRIDHGADYPRFYRAIGDAACFVAERHGQVLGTLGAAIRLLQLPTGALQPALYVGDLKIAPGARGGRVLLRLAERAQQWARGRVEAAFAVVMDGTTATPPRYTGRLGLPAFQELGKIIVLRLSTAGAEAEEAPTTTVDEVTGASSYGELSTGRYACPGGNPGERSALSPRWLRLQDGSACGRLEDTRRGKRLIAHDGVEMVSAHLSCFAYRRPADGAALVRAAVHLAGTQRFPALFVALPPSDVEALCRGLPSGDVVIAPATVFGAGLQPEHLWNINTAEI